MLSALFMHSESDPSQLPLLSEHTLCEDSPAVQHPCAEIQAVVRRRHRMFMCENATCLSKTVQLERQRFLRLDAAKRRIAAITALFAPSSSVASTTDASTAVSISSSIFLRTTTPSVSVIVGALYSVTRARSAATAALIEMN